MNKNSGFTLIEVMVSTMLLVVALLGSLGVFARLLGITESDKSYLIAQKEAEAKMEELTRYNYPALIADYTNAGALKSTPFNLSSTMIIGKGVVYAQELSGAANSLLSAKVVVCYRQKGRIVGEDTNLNGILDGAEDQNNNARIDSPCQLDTVMVNKEI